MTQTMRPASFGPVFVVAAHLCLYIISQYMYNTKEKKKHTYGPNDVLKHVVWARFRCHCLFHTFKHQIEPIYNINN